MDSAVDEETYRKAYNWCQDYLGGAWGKIKPAELQIVPLSGGYSNRSYLCSLPSEQKTTGKEPNKVLLRIYGVNLNPADPTHKTDTVVRALLSEHGCAPKLFGFFPEGTLEQYIPSRCLRTSDLWDPIISQKIAVKMAAYHKLELPLSKEQYFMNKGMPKLIHFALNGEFNDPDWQKYVEKLRSCDIEAEYQFVRKLAAGTSSPIVFCHNDVHAENILLTTEDADCQQNNIWLIDYDSSVYGYRDNDIASLFCSWAIDFRYNEPPYFKLYPEKFPTREQQLLFIRAYLNTFETDYDYPHGNKEAEEESILLEVTRFIPIYHFKAAIGSLMFAMGPKVKLRFADFGMMRLEQYFVSKNELPDNLRPNMT